jgi:hypothetical protein
VSQRHRAPSRDHVRADPAPAAAALSHRAVSRLP